MIYIGTIGTLLPHKIKISRIVVVLCSGDGCFDSSGGSNESSNSIIVIVVDSSSRPTSK